MNKFLNRFSTFLQTIGIINVMILIILISVGSFMKIKIYNSSFSYISFCLSLELLILSISKNIRERVLYIQKHKAYVFLTNVTFLLAIPILYSFIRIQLSFIPNFEDPGTIIMIFISLIDMIRIQFNEKI